MKKPKLDPRSHSKAQLRQWWKLYEACGFNMCELARREGGSRTTWQARLRNAEQRLGVSAPQGVSGRPRKPGPAALTDAQLEAVWSAFAANGFNETRTARALGVPRGTIQKRLQMCEARLDKQKPGAVRGANGLVSAQRDALVRALRRPGGATVEEASAALQISKGEALDAIDALAGESFNIHKTGDHYAIHAVPLSGVTTGRQVLHQSDERGMYRFGLVADSHIGSKYARIDVLERIYDQFAAEGVERVYHCGNMIDGFKAGVNDHDVVVAGMDDQIGLLVKEYPRRKGVTTLAVSGDDHEGWFAQKMGIDIGKRIEQSMREAGRTDWVDLGYMECFVTLQHRESGAEAKLLVSHPGGGSSYADSYVVQKIVESYDGGEKPGIAAFGHYHKCLSGEYRNVWYFLVPCTQDQTPWARKKRLRYVIGGMIVEAWQNADTGAIERCRDEKLRFFNRGYYNDRWNHAGTIVLPERTR